MTHEYINEWPLYSPPDQAKKDNVLIAARLMVNAALTAPFTGGVHSHEADIVYGQTDLERIAREMERLAHEAVPKKLKKPFLYEAAMLRETDVVVLIGNFRARNSPMDAGCGLCGGEPDCSFFYERVTHFNGVVDPTDRRRKSNVNGPLCMIRAHDQGYALGSALWTTSTLFVDAKPSHAVGLAGRNLDYCPNSELVIGIMVAAASKNPYADIPPEYHLTNMRMAVDALRKIAVISRQIPNHPYMTHSTKKGVGAPSNAEEE